MELLHLLNGGHTADAVLPASLLLPSIILSKLQLRFGSNVANGFPLAYVS